MSVLGRRVSMVDPSHPFEDQVSGKKPLPNTLTDMAARARFRRVDAEIYGPLSTPRAPQEARQQVWLRRWKQSRPEGSFDPLISDVQRLVKGSERLDGFLDLRRGRVLLAERSDPPGRKSPPGLQPVRLHRARRIARGDPGLSAFLAECLPEATADLLDRLGIQIERGEPTQVPQRYRDRYGPAAEWVFKANPPVAGSWANYLWSSGLVQIKPLPDAPPSLVHTIALHELMHAVDWALGTGGRQYSSTPEWRSLFEATRAREGHGGTCLPFPTAYSQTDSSEFFADCAATFLSSHVDSSGNVAVREDLRRHLPDVEAALDRLFSETIPDAVARQILQKPDDAFHAATERARGEGEVPTGHGWLQSAVFSLQRYADAGDKAQWEDARAALHRAKQAMGTAAPAADQTLLRDFEDVLHSTL
ncbi:MAG TPA: hypothetical protein VEY30_02950, partial [Myxococcaceae bacterium]|nr:hypothetical protein [Myxococcaceae bacterium]